MLLTTSNVSVERFVKEEGKRRRSRRKLKTWRRRRWWKYEAFGSGSDWKRSFLLKLEAIVSK